MLKSKTDVKEKLIVSGVFVGIFLPVRILFYTYVSDFWLGSLGLISLLAFMVTYLSHKDKLGAFGRMWKKQIQKLAKGKWGAIFLTLAIFTISFYGFSIYAFNAGQDIPAYDIVIGILKDSDLTLTPDLGKNVEMIQSAGDSINIPESIGRSLDGFDALLRSNPQEMINVFVLSLAVLDGWSGGWFQHFYIVFFVEEIERLGLTIYFRYFYKG